MGTGEFTAGGNPAMDQHPIQGGGGVKILIVTSCYRNQDKLGPYGPLGLNADLTFIVLQNYNNDDDDDDDDDDVMIIVQYLYSSQFTICPWRFTLKNY